MATKMRFGTTQEQRFQEQGLTRTRDKQRVADRVLEKEKDKPIGQVFDGRFSWDAMLDAIADVYLGVSSA